MMMNMLALALGGALGAITRYFISTQLARSIDIAFPYGTLTVNVVGSFLIGLAISFFLEHQSLPPYLKLFVVTGFLGALTTFSTFSFETLELIRSHTYMGILNLALNIIGGLIAVTIGIKLG